MTSTLNEKTKKLEVCETDIRDFKLINHEQDLRIKELEAEKQMLNNHVERLNQELNNISSSLQGKKEFGDDEIRNLLDEHKSEKDEWEKIRES